MAVTTKKPPAHQWYYDVETVDWDRPVCAVAIRDDGEREDFVGPGCLERLAHVMEEEGGTWWAHAGGIFDHLLVWRDSQRLPREVILAGSSVLRGTARPSPRRRALVFRDSFPRTLSSLKKWGEALGTPKREVDRSKISEMSARDTLEYCASDVEILKLGSLTLDAWLASYGVKAHTSGSAAMGLLESMDPASWEVMARPDCEVDLDVLTGVGMAEDGGDVEDDEEGTPKGLECAGALEAVRGGRVEIRRVGPVAGPVYAYDIHSAHPSQWTRGAFPVGCERTTSRKLEAWGWVDWCTWKCPSKMRAEWHARTAPELSQDGSGGMRCEGYLTWETAAWIASLGWEVKRHGVGWRPAARLENPGAGFIPELFRLKEGGGPISFAAKVTINSSHGKFSENPMRWRHLLREDAKGYWGRGAPWSDFYDETRIVLPTRPYHQPLMAATILGRSRLQLARTIHALESAGWDFYYCDTDCVHTNCPPEQFRLLAPLGDALGEWGLEKTWAEAVYLSPKVYAGREESGKVKAKAKGFPELPFETYLRAYDLWAQDADTSGARIERDDGIGRFRSGGELGVRRSLARHLRPVLTHRHASPDGRVWYGEGGGTAHVRKSQPPQEP